MTTLHDARQRAYADWQKAVREWEEQPTQRNADRVKIKLTLLDGLKRWIAERTYGGAR